MTASAVTEAQIRALIEAVDRADQAGNRQEAERALARARAAAPDYPGVLNVAGMRALRGGDAGAALPLLERAAALDPGSPMLWVNLALAHRELREEAAERDAIEKALEADPRFYPALLHKARLFERQGKLKAAAHMYHAFLCCVPAGVQHPRAVLQAMEHANQVLRKNDAALEAFLQPRVDAARARHPGARLERFDACFETLIGKRAVFAPQPSFMLFPRLPAIEFLDRDDFPWLDAFETATDEIRAEARAALAQAGDDFVPYISKPPGSPIDQWKELNSSKRWSTFFLLKNGARIKDHLARCPKTAALLEAAPLCRIPAHAPTAFFSVLAPKTRIPAHTGVTNTRLIVHLPLIVPPSCGFRVGAETRAWREGHAWVFDDTFEHEAWNESDEPRVVLIFDVWNLFLTPAERDLVSEVTHGVHDYSEGESPFRQGG
ncbi:MAG: aspartyl/asparaginyl beta-hydroxylase domain-containing protein [Betaproteobacteria bacterium]|nr:aspartyl/asparaginyl beta-hydroxylase domain-containing protein [Betaproteobacteria bacterium]